MGESWRRQVLTLLARCASHGDCYCDELARDGGSTLPCIPCEARRLREAA